MNIKLVFPIFFILIFPFQTVASRWTELNGIGRNQPQSEIPNRREGAVAFNLNNEIFYGGGFFENLTSISFSDFHKYNPTLNKWSKYARTPFDANSINSKFQTFALNDRGYYCDKNNGVWEFDPFLNSWSQKNNYPGSRRYDFTCFSINQKGYILLGSDSSNIDLNTFYEFDPILNSWISKTPFPGTGRRNAIVFSFQDKGVICGGYSSNFSTIFNDTWSYDPIIDTWQTRSTLNDTIGNTPFTFVISNKGFLISDSTVWEYNNMTGIWVKKNDITIGPITSEPYNDWAGVSVSGFGYAINGELIFKYDSSVDEWTEVSTINNTYGKSIKIGNVVLLNGWKYDLTFDKWTKDTTLNCYWMFAIGTKAYGLHNNIFQSYNYNNSTWNIEAPMPSFGYFDSGFTLGGKGYYLDEKSLYEYDTSLNQWTQKDSFPGNTLYGGIVFTYNNQAYYGLGFDQSGFGISDFWKYSQQNNNWSELAEGPQKGFMYYSNINNIGYCGGGQFVESGVSAESGLFQYNINLNKWTDLSYICSSNYGTARSDGFCFNNLGSIYVGGGGGGYVRNYDPANIDFSKYDPNSLIISLTLPSILCAGAQYFGDYSAITTFNTTNSLSIVLSDSTGDFSNSTILKSIITSDSTGNFNFIIPYGNYYGNSYKIRIETSSPEDCSNFTDSFSIGSVHLQSFIGQDSLISPFQILPYSVGFEPNLNYQWNVTNGNIISGQGTNSVTIQWGNFIQGQIQIVASDGICFDTLTDTVDINPNRIENISSQRINFYPNPVIDKINLNILNECKIGCNFNILNMFGEIIKREILQEDKINVSDLVPGVYIFEISSTGRWEKYNVFIKIN